MLKLGSLNRLFFYFIFIVPIGDPPGDGMTYPYNPILHNRLIEDARVESQSQDDRISSMMQQVPQ